MSMEKNAEPKYNSLVFYRDWWGFLKRLTPEERIETMEDILLYAFDGMTPSRKDRQDRVYLMLETIKRDREKYERIRERRRESVRRRWGKREAEEKAPAQAPEAPAADTNVRENAYKCIQYVNGNVNDNGNVNENENESLSHDSDIRESARACMHEAADDSAELREEFDRFRRAYPGAKRGLAMEWDGLRRKHRKEWRAIVPLLMPALERMQAHRAALEKAGQWTPQVPMLSTWINQGRWTEEYPAVAPAAPARMTARTAPAPDRDARRMDLMRAAQEGMMDALEGDDEWN